MATLTVTPPFKADQVGSLLRPAHLLESRERRKRGEITAAELRRIEDAAIRDVVAMQEQLGMQSITDGEFRRGLWHMDFVCDFANVQQAPGIPIKFHSEEGEIEWAPPGVKITGKLVRPHPIFVDDFRFLKAITTATPKITIPSPSVLHFRGGRKAIDAAAYPDMEEFYADLARAQRKAPEGPVEPGPFRERRQRGASAAGDQVQTTRLAPALFGGGTVGAVSGGLRQPDADQGDAGRVANSTGNEPQQLGQ